MVSLNVPPASPGPTPNPSPGVPVLTEDQRLQVRGALSRVRSGLLIEGRQRAERSKRVGKGHPTDPRWGPARDGAFELDLAARCDRLAAAAARALANVDVFAAWAARQGYGAGEDPLVIVIDWADRHPTDLPESALD